MKMAIPWGNIMWYINRTGICENLSWENIQPSLLIFKLL